LKSEISNSFDSVHPNQSHKTKRVLACFIRLSKSRYSQASWKEQQTITESTRLPRKVKRRFDEKKPRNIEVQWPLPGIALSQRGLSRWMKNM
jgi:hypothetical protein